MPIYKATFLYNFTGQPPCGFSETWYLNASDQDVATSRMTNYLGARRLMMASQWNFIGARLSELSVVGTKIKAKSVYLCPTLTLWSGAAGNADTPTSAVLLRFTLGSIAEPKRRNQQLRGIPDSWWDAATLTIPNAAKGQINSWAATMRTAQIGQVQRVGSVLSVNIVRCVAPVRISERRIGRPFGLLRGSRRKKKAPA